MVESPSHTVTENGKTVVIHDLEVFCAYDPTIDTDHDTILKKFDNQRVKRIVKNTQAHMDRGAFPQLVVMHNKDGDEPKSSVGRVTAIRYEDRDGVGYIVGDCEVERSAFDRLLATNAFPRRSAEIWDNQNHLSEVALLGRDTPRRPLPDTNFVREGNRLTFSRPLVFDMGTVGSGLNTFIPTTDKDHNTMPEEAAPGGEDLATTVNGLKTQMDRLEKMCRKAMPFMFDEGTDEDPDIKATNDADDMLVTQESPDEDTEKIDSSRPDTAILFSIRRENSRMRGELSELRSNLAREQFSRELDTMESEGYRIPATKRPQLLSELESSVDPSATLEGWRELFARDPIGRRIDMSRAVIPNGGISPQEMNELVRTHAGKPDEFRKAINARTR